MKDENIICISWLEWDCIPLVMHHMMTRLSVHNRVLWVDPLFPLTSLITRPYPVSFYKDKIKNWWYGIKKASDNLWVYYPPPLLLFYGRVRINDKFNQFFLSVLIRKIAKHLEFNSPILWLYHPYAVLPKGQFSEKLVCYDCNDDMGAFFHRLPYQRRQLSDLEAKLVKIADIVFTTSKNLYQSKKKINPNTYYVPSGTDISLFSKVLLSTTKVSNEIADIKKPIIGFTGGIDNTKINWDWIEKAANHRTDWSFVLIGPVHQAPPVGITRLSNLHFLGKRPIEELPNYIKAFDVCIIPYKEGEFMRSSFPTKTFEYLAGGKPVVASDIPALRDYQPIVKLCESSEEFILSIEKSIKESDDVDLQKRRFQTAKGQTWDARIRKTTLVIDHFLH